MSAVLALGKYKPILFTFFHVISVKINNVTEFVLNWSPWNIKSVFQKTISTWINKTTQRNGIHWCCLLYVNHNWLCPWELLRSKFNRTLASLRHVIHKQFHSQFIWHYFARKSAYFQRPLDSVVVWAIGTNREASAAAQIEIFVSNFIIFESLTDRRSWILCRFNYSCIH